jgi:hypothetical protein
MLLFRIQLRRQHLKNSVRQLIRRRLAAIDKNKSVGRDVSGQILELGVEVIIPYLARRLDITVNNATTLSD